MSKGTVGYGLPGCGAPFFYNYQNVWDSVITPATVSVANTGMAYFFKRYLFQRAMSVFKWEVPENWEKNYFLYTLYGWGYCAIVNTDKFGVIPQGCGLRGYNVMYQPTHAIITNPLLRGTLEPQIDKQCVIIRLQPDYGSIMDIVDYFGNNMALAASTMQVNLFNSRYSFVFAAQNKRAADTFKSMYDNLSEGQPAIAVDKTLFMEDGTPLWQAFEQNVGSNYIASDISNMIRTFVNDFDSYVGIPNNNVQKKERAITDEVNANNIETKVLAQGWLQELQKSCEKARKMFGIKLSVDWRFKDEMEGGVIDASNNVGVGNAVLR